MKGCVCSVVCRGTSISALVRFVVDILGVVLLFLYLRLSSSGSVVDLSGLMWASCIPRLPTVLLFALEGTRICSGRPVSVCAWVLVAWRVCA